MAQSVSSLTNMRLWCSTKYHNTLTYISARYRQTLNFLGTIYQDFLTWLDVHQLAVQRAFAVASLVPIIKDMIHQALPTYSRLNAVLLYVADGLQIFTAVYLFIKKP